MKKWYKSKTIWFNALLGLFALLAELQSAVDILASAEHSRIYMGTVLAGNIVLRFITTQGVGGAKND